MKCKIIWFTGLSGSGKTTLANHIYKQIRLKKFKIKKIDGDIIRKKNKEKKFNKKSIIKNNLYIINYIDKIKSNYDYIIVSVISPIKKTRLIAKTKFKKNYFEIYTKCSIKELTKRDTKNLYSMAKKKIIKNLIGFNSKIKYEMTNYNKLVVNTSKHSINYCSNAIVKHISK